MTTIIIILISAAVGGVLTHFFWARFHQDVIQGLHVALDSAQAEIARLRNLVK
jgi:hypothetical protein